MKLIKICSKMLHASFRTLTKGNYFLFFLCPIVCVATTAQTPSKAPTAKEDKKPTFESSAVKEALIKKDFYQKYKENLSLDPNAPLSEQQAHIKKTFLDYKYSTFKTVFLRSSIQATVPLIVLTVLTICLNLYCFFATFDEDLKELLVPVREVMSKQSLFTSKNDNDLRYALSHIGCLVLCIASFPIYLKYLNAFMKIFGNVLGQQLFTSLLGLVGMFPHLALLGIIVIDVVFNIRNNVWHYLKLRSGVISFIDEMEASELLYIQNQHRLPQALQTIIEKALFEARKYPQKRPLLHEFVKNAVALPTKKELHARVNFDTQDIDLSGLQEYDSEVQEELIELILRYREGVKLYYNYFVGPSGVGKTNALKLLEEKLGVKIAIVSFAGASAKDLLGTPYSGDKQGDIGRIAEAIRNASPYGERPLILFIDELDKALEGPYAKEIETLCLKLFERSNDSLDSPYLKGYKIPLPHVIVFAGNNPIKGALNNRLKTTVFEEYSWEKKERIIRMKLPQICQNLHIDPSSLTQEDYDAIHAIIGQIKKKAEANPKDPKYAGVREIERQVLKYLEKNQMKKQGFMKRFKKNPHTKSHQKSTA